MSKGLALFLRRIPLLKTKHLLPFLESFTHGMDSWKSMDHFNNCGTLFTVLMNSKYVDTQNNMKNILEGDSFSRDFSFNGFLVSVLPNIFLLSLLLWVCGWIT